MENDMVDDLNESDDSADFEQSCPYRSPSLSEALLEEQTVKTIQSRVATIIGVGDQFVKDLDVVLEKCGSSNYVIIILHELAVDLAKALKGDKYRITVDAIKKPTWNNMPDFKRVDTMHILQTILLRELPPERFGGIINLLLATRRRATTEEVEDSLRYLYGSGPYAKIANLPPLPSKHRKAIDMDNAGINENSLNKLKSLVDLRPQVIDDVSTVFEKFPHDNIITPMFFTLTNTLKEDLHGDTSKIDALSIKENAQDGDDIVINAMESILSTRLAEEDYRGLIDFMKAIFLNTSIDDTESALEYLYGPKR